MQITCIHCQFEFELEGLNEDTVSCRRCGKTFSASSGLARPLPETSILMRPADGDQVESEVGTESIHSGMSFAVTSDVGPYELAEQLGEGGFGTVYRARHRVLNRFDAVKLPRSDRFSSRAELNEFLREAAVSVQLAHPNIVPVYTAEWSADGRPFIAMRLMSGRTFGSFLRTSPLMTKVIEMLAVVCDAVHYAHLNGYFHRDLKPSNILLDEHGVPYVSDFGLALHISEQLDRPGDARCSRMYAAPEQIQGRSEHLDGRCDIYAIGAILYEVLAGCPVFQGTQTQVIEQILYRPPQPPSQRRSSDAIPAELESLCLQCLEKDVERRPKSMKVVADRLREWLRVERAYHIEDTAAFVPAKVTPAGKRDAAISFAKLAILIGSGAFLATLIAIVGISYLSVLAGPGGPNPPPPVRKGEVSSGEPDWNVLRDPDLVDEWALPNQRFRLSDGVKLKPVRLVWSPNEIISAPVFTPESESLRLETNSISLCAVGRTELKNWRMTVPLSNPSKTGAFGVFYGMRRTLNEPVANDPTDCWQVCCLVIRSSDGRGWKVYRRILYVAQQGERFEVRGLIDLHAIDIEWERAPQQIIGISVKDDRLSEVRWNGKLIALDDYSLAMQERLNNPTNLEQLELPGAGWFGVLNEAGSTTFQQLDFLKSERH